MKTSTYIRAASIAASDAADLFDAASVSGGTIPGSQTIRKAVRKLKQSTAFTNKAIAQADDQDTILEHYARTIRKYGDALDAMTKEYVA